MKYRAVYRCSMCGETFPIEKAVQLDEKHMSLDYILFALYTYTGEGAHMMHKCKDGSAGVAYFAGFKKDRDHEV